VFVHHPFWAHIPQLPATVATSSQTILETICGVGPVEGTFVGISVGAGVGTCDGDLKVSLG